MKRRTFITLVGGAAAAWPPIVHAQQSENLARIGFLPLGSPTNHYDVSYVEAFRNGLTDNGLVDGRNIRVDVLWVANEAEYDQAVIELIRRRARVLVPAGSSASAAAKRQTSTIPIIFISVGDPVGIGIVESLPHPGGNATGFTDVLADLSSKFIEFARDLDTRGVPVGYLWHNKWPDGQHRLVATEQAAQAAGVLLRPRSISDIGELDAIVSDLRSNGMTIIIVQPSPFTYRYRNRIFESMTKNGLANICAWPPGPEEGAVIGYGPDYADIYRRAGSYISRILAGEKPADLPVQNPTKFRLVINLNAAKTLGLQIPATLIAVADQVIE